MILMDRSPCQSECISSTFLLSKCTSRCGHNMSYDISPSRNAPPAPPRPQAGAFSSKLGEHCVQSQQKQTCALLLSAPAQPLSVTPPFILDPSCVTFTAIRPRGALPSQLGLHQGACFRFTTCSLLPGTILTSRSARASGSPRTSSTSMTPSCCSCASPWSSPSAPTLEGAAGRATST